MAEPTPSQLGPSMTLSGSPIPRSTLELPDYEHLRDRDYGPRTRFDTPLSGIPTPTPDEVYASIRAGCVPRGEIDRAPRTAADAVQATRRASAQRADADLADTVERLAADVSELLGK